MSIIPDAIYARQSVDKKDSISIETQIELCRSECMSEDVLIYIDKGYSGSNTNRPEVQRMMDDIRKGLISKVHVYRFDRISRSLPDFVKMTEEFRRYNCEFSSYTERFDTGTPIGMAMVQIFMVFAQLERENTIQRVQDAYSARSKEGFYMGGRVPYGFTLKETTSNGKKTSMYVPVPEEVEQLKMIFELYSQPDTTLNGIVKKLIKDGVLNLRGSTWQTARLSDTIKNPCYVKTNADIYRFFKNNGTIIVNDISEFDGHAGFMYGRRNHGKKFSNIDGQTLVIALHEGIIEPDIWLRCQYKLSRNKQIKRTGLGKTTWLSGLVRCGKCGNTMKITRSNTRAGRYFNCTGRSELHICEGHTCTIYADAVETLVSKEIEDCLANNEFRGSEKKTASDREINDLSIKLSEVETEIAQLMDKLAKSNEVLFEYINRRISELDAQKRLIQKSINEKQLLSIDKTDILELNKIWSEGDFEKKKLIAKTLIKEIRIVDSQIEIVWKL